LNYILIIQPEDFSKTFFLYRISCANYLKI